MRNTRRANLFHKIMAQEHQTEGVRWRSRHSAWLEIGSICKWHVNCLKYSPKYDVIAPLVSDNISGSPWPAIQHEDVKCAREWSNSLKQEETRESWRKLENRESYRCAIKKYCYSISYEIGGIKPESSFFLKTARLDPTLLLSRCWLARRVSVVSRSVTDFVEDSEWSTINTEDEKRKHICDELRGAYHWWREQSSHSPTSIEQRNEILKAE